jgi:hypothetical protein
MPGPDGQPGARSLEAERRKRESRSENKKLPGAGSLQPEAILLLALSIRQPISATKKEPARMGLAGFPKEDVMAHHRNLLRRILVSLRVTVKIILQTR